MITTSYSINSMSVLSSSDIVKSVIIGITFTNDTGHSYSYESIVELDEPSSNFTPFEELTVDQVVAWCEAKVFQGPESKASVLQRVEEMFNNDSLVNKLPAAWSN